MLTGSLEAGVEGIGGRLHNESLTELEGGYSSVLEHSVIIILHNNLLHIL